MYIKFFVSDTCPKCLPVKVFYEELKAILKDHPVDDIKLKIYDHKTDMYQFLFHDIVTVPVVVVCSDNFKEIGRYAGYDEIMNNRENIEWAKEIQI